MVSHSGAQCITCSYKASSGLLYPLERGFIYVHKPPVHLRFEEISSVNFARGTTTTRSFDFEIETKQGSQYTFSSIERYTLVGSSRSKSHRPMQIQRTNSSTLSPSLTLWDGLFIAVGCVQKATGLHPLYQLFPC